jgi:hypothetical protein
MAAVLPANRFEKSCQSFNPANTPVPPGRQNPVHPRIFAGFQAWGIVKKSEKTIAPKTAWTGKNGPDRRIHPKIWPKGAALAFEALFWMGPIVTFDFSGAFFV